MTSSKVLSNIFCESFIGVIDPSYTMLDGDNVVWKYSKGRWIGKRSVWTIDRRACWLEDTTESNVKNWWCGGREADYEETFIRH